MIGFRATILSSTALGMAALWSVPAMAQSNAAPAAQPGAAAVKPDTSEAIIVTGSRIRRKDFVAESPIQTLNASQIASKGPATLDASLTSMPQFSASSGSATQAGANQQARGARANLNLRGLGIARTLVLLDGRRLVSSDPVGNAVDLNTIPANILANVEVISGGASAVYGSDAIAGVVNLITKKNFTGVQLDGQYGQTTRDDGATVDLSALLGTHFGEDDRGHAMLSLSFFDRKAAYKGNRSYFDGTGDTNAPPQGRYTPSSGNLPSQAALNSLFSSYGSAAPSASQALSINRDGTLFSTGPTRNLRLNAADGFGLSRDGSGLVTAFTPFASGTILTPLRRYNAYGTLDYKITDSITAYGIVNYTTYHATNQQRGTLNGTSPVATIPVTNPFLPADLRTVLASRPNPNASFNYSFFGDRVAPQVFTYDYNVGQITAGLKGDLGLGDFTFDVSGSYGKTIYKMSASGYININALQSLLNAGDGGASICSGGFNPFSFAAVSSACSGYLTRTLHERTTLDQYTAEANFEGSLFHLPAGEARLAAGLDYRRNSYSFTGDNQQINSEVYFSRPVQNSGGAQGAKEVYAELSLPLLRDKPFAKTFDVDLAYRYSNYDGGIGGVSAYKASADWEIASALRLRGGYQRAVRAPSVGELFGGGRSVSSAIGTTASGQGDPCDATSAYRTGANAAQVRALCIAQGVPSGTVDTYRFTGTTVTTSQTGNTALKPEKADTFTVGAVLRSPFSAPALSHITFSVDFYSIKVANAIGNITTAVSLQRCFNGDGSNPGYSASNYYCSLLRRDANGNLNFPQEPALNLSAYKTSGLDFQADYQVDLEQIGLAKGRVSLNAAMAYVMTYDIQSFAGSPFLNYAGTVGNTQIDTFTSTHPRWKGQTTLGYSLSPVDVAVTWNYVGPVGNATNVTTPSANVAGVAHQSTFDALLRWKVNKVVELRASLQNMFDADPPVGPTPGAADLVAYDVLGRRFSLGINARF